MDFNLWTAIQNFLAKNLAKNSKLYQGKNRDRWSRSCKTKNKGKMVKRLGIPQKRNRRKMAKRSRRINRRRAA